MKDTKPSPCNDPNCLAERSKLKRAFSRILERNRELVEYHAEEPCLRRERDDLLKNVEELEQEVSFQRETVRQLLQKVKGGR